MRTRVAPVAAVLALGIVLTGCSQPQTQEQAEAGACDAIAAVADAVSTLQGLTADSTVEQAQQAKDQLDTSIKELETSVEGIATADQTALVTGVDEIQTAIEGFSEGDTIGDAVNTVKTSASTLQSAVADIRDGVSCS